MKQFANCDTNPPSKHKMWTDRASNWLTERQSPSRQMKLTAI